MRRATQRSTAQTNGMQRSDAFDLAFEDYTRVDIGVVRDSAVPGPQQATKLLIANIAAQLSALD
jgi:hypothetical protein